ncbi:MAG: peptidylprolyl isomerase [Verrucomicrobiales bacterium]|nr:peptidylprolyl isomerase [Verrucomicrobiales bacterium]
MKRLFLILLVLVVHGLPLVARSQPVTNGLYAGFVTSQGTFWAWLEYQRAPRTVANFVSLAEGTRDWIDFPASRIVRRPFYHGLTFHRVIKNFMIQGGSPNGRGTDGPGYQFADEFHPELKHFTNGILSMANSGKNSNGSQFFVTVTNTGWLDGLHSVFGRVVEGMDIVHALSKVPTSTGDRPVTPVVLNEVRIVRVGAEAQAFQPSAVTPALPGVEVVPTAILYAPGKLNLLLQSKASRNQHAFFSSDLVSWVSQTFAGQATNLNAASLLGEPRLFFRVIAGGVEP